VPAELRAKIDDKFEQVKTALPWEILEVEKEADRDRLKKAFYTLAKVYHPDRVTNSGDEELVHRLDVIIAKVNESYQILSDPHAKMAFLAKQGAAGPSSAAGKQQHRPEDARIQYQKAMVFYKKRDLSKAAELLRWATDMDSGNGEYLAWRHWVDYERGEESEEIKRDKLKGDLLALSKSQPDCFSAARFLAKIYQMLNDSANYEKFLTKAAKLNPRDVEVTRELRLYRTRKEKADAKGKFLGIRFKKTED
jgi:curved DNA-binding protein CbpA